MPTISNKLVNTIKKTIRNKEFLWLYCENSPEFLNS